MAEEPEVKTTDSGATTDPKPADNMEQVDGAELARLKERDATLTEMDAWAKEADIDDAKTYIEQLEIAVNQTNQPAPEPAVSPKVETPPKTETPPTPAPAGLSAAQLSDLDASNKRSTQAMLDVHHLRWANTQGVLSETERSPAERKDLDKIIMSNPAAIQQLASDRLYDGNVYAAADALFGASSEGVRKAKESAAAAEKAKADAAAGATLLTGGTTAKPSTETSEEKALTETKERQDAIWKDDPPYEPPIN